MEERRRTYDREEVVQVCGNHSRERNENSAGSAIEQIHPEHREGEVGRRNVDDAVEGDAVGRVGWAREGLAEREGEKGREGSALCPQRCVTAIMNALKRYGVCRGVLRPMIVPQMRMNAQAEVGERSVS
jgi:hypothetical protein